MDGLFRANQKSTIFLSMKKFSKLNNESSMNESGGKEKNKIQAYISQIRILRGQIINRLSKDLNSMNFSIF